MYLRKFGTDIAENLHESFDNIELDANVYKTNFIYYISGYFKVSVKS